MAGGEVLGKQADQKLNERMREERMGATTNSLPARAITEVTKAKRANGYAAPGTIHLLLSAPPTKIKRHQRDSGWVKPSIVAESSLSLFSCFCVFIHIQ